MMRSVEIGSLPRAASLAAPALALVLAIFPSCARAVTPLGLPKDTPDLPPNRAAFAELGRRLFTDTRLSANGMMSCATCHIPEKHFTDGRPTARGRDGRSLTRHTPSLLNVRYLNSLFWDGRASDLAAQARTPLLGRAEHGLTERTAAELVRSDDYYAATFPRLTGVKRNSLSIRDIALALSAYERTLLAADSAFDRSQFGHDRTAMTPAARRGFELFRGRAKCASCHSSDENSALFTDQEFHASPLPLPESAVSQLGELTAKVEALRTRGYIDELNALISTDRDIAALGRFTVTLDPRDIGSFKTPSLRNVALTGPYMHDGSVASLPQAIEIELYSRSPGNYPIVLTEDEREDLLQFLLALSSP